MWQWSQTKIIYLLVQVINENGRIENDLFTKTTDKHHIFGNAHRVSQEEEAVRMVPCDFSAYALLQQHLSGELGICASF